MARLSFNGGHAHLFLANSSYDFSYFFFRIIKKAIFLVTFSPCFIFQSVLAQVVITALAPYVQNFNSLPATGSGPWVNNTTLPGWYLPAGISTLTADNGNSSADGFYSYGSTAATDRALGAINSCSFKIRMKNTTGGVIRHFKISYRVEMWHKSTGHTKPVSFSYVQGPEVDPAAAYTETTVTELQADSYTSINGGALNGNAEFLTKEFLIRNVILPAGHEIRFTWTGQKTTWGLALDDVVIEPTNVTVFYNNNLSDLTSPASWGTNKDGSSSQPLNFTDPNQLFCIANYPANTNITLPGTWAVSGTDSRLVIGDGTNAVTTRIPNNHALGATLIDVTDNGTLAINSRTLPQFGSLSPRSIIVFEKEAPADITSGTVFGTVVFNSGKNNRLTRKIKVKGNLVLQDAKLELGDHDLELGYGAAIQVVAANQYVVLNGKGRIRQGIRAGQEVTLPIGKTSYNPVKIKLAAGTQEDIFSVQVLDGVYGTYTNDVPALHAPILEKTVNKTWIVSEDVPGGSDITLTLSWSLTDALAGFNPADCHIKHYEHGTWDEYLSAAAAAVVSLTGTTFSISRPGITSFSPFGVGSGPMTVLPVDLLHFGAKENEEKDVVLTWATAMEKNHDHFAIEASEDGRNFREVGRVQGRGDSHTRRQYSFIHRPNAAATTYYRLKQTDLDQAFTYSRVVAVAGQARPMARLTVSPNPSKDLFYLNAREGSLLLASVSDVSGRQVLPAQPLNFSDGRYALDLSGQSAGVYLLHLVSSQSRQVIRLVKN